MTGPRITRLRPSDAPWDVPIIERELTKLIMDYLKWVPNSSFKKIRGSMGMRGILDIIGCWEGQKFNSYDVSISNNSVVSINLLSNSA